MSSPAFSRPTLVLALTVLLAGCGGSSSTTTSSSSTDSVTLTGSAVAGAVTGSVTVSDAQGTSLATATVSGGSFSVSLPKSALSGELDFAVTGSYTDEVSGGTVQLASGGLALRLAAGTLSGDGTVGITPESSVIREMVAAHNMTLTQAREAFQNAFGHLPDDTVRPFDPSAAEPAWADDTTRDAAFRVGAWSQWGNDLGLAGDNLAALPAALAADLADGSLDGQDGNGAMIMAGNVNLEQAHQGSALMAGYLGAMASFAGSTQNVAGLTAPNTGLPPLAGGVDSLPAQRTITLADGTQLKVQLTVQGGGAFPMGPATARTIHRVSLTDAATGAPVDITATGAKVTAIKSSAQMHRWQGHSHSTPLVGGYDAVTSNPAQGIYDFEVYYVMASGMTMNGMSTPMGLWDFKLTLSAGAESPVALFHPNVTMPMGEAVLSAKGGDAKDQVASMTGGATTPRPYWVWLRSIAANAGGGHDLGLFVSTKVGMMFPAVTAGGGAITNMMDSLTVNTATVEISTDSGTTWNTLTSDGQGRYSLANMAGLTAGSLNTLAVRLTVNGNVISSAAGGNLALTFKAP